MRHSQPAVLAVSCALFGLLTVTLAPVSALAQDQKLVPATGKLMMGRAIGVAHFRWGMTASEILTAPLDGVATVRALEGKGPAFQVDKLQLNPSSPYGWTLLLWLDKKGLSAFELRPTREVYTNTVVGYPDEKIAADFQRELDLHIERVFKIQPDQWWQDSDQAQVSVKTQRTQTTTVESPGYLVPSPSGSGPAGYIPPSSTPVTRTYKQFNFQPVTLFFSIKDRAWHLKDNHYRQGYLYNSKGKLRLAVVRFQGRREGKPFEPVTGELVKTRDAGVLIRAIFKNYNVNALADR